MEQHYTTDNTIDNTTAQELRKFRRNGGLIRRKLIEYIPVMILTNLLLLLISTVNGLIAGNFLGEDAFSSINIFYPVSVLLAAFGAVTAVGIATSISTAMGRNNLAELARVKGASLYTMLGMAVFMGIVQIPIVSLIISSYHLPPEMHSLTWQYAIGIMLCQPFSLISTVGTYQLQVSGKMKVLMMLTIAESLSNLAFDLLFVAVLHMGVAGTGYGTLCANIVRCTATVIYIRHKTDFYSIGNYKPCLKDIREMGLPSGDGRGPAIVVSSSIGISAQTNAKKVCVEFIKTLFSEEIQEKFAEYDTSTPVNVKAFKKAGLKSIDKYNANYNRNKSQYSRQELMSSGLAWCEVDKSAVDVYEKVIRSCSCSISEDPSISVIVKEEMPAYLTGQKSLDDVIKIINDRSKTVVSERG